MRQIWRCCITVTSSPNGGKVKRTLTFKGHYKNISNMYQIVRLRQNWRSQIWGVKILPHNQDECDFMLILLSVSCFTTPLWRESVLCLIWNLCWESVKHRYHTKVGKNDFRNSKGQNGLLNNISFPMSVWPISHFGNLIV